MRESENLGLEKKIDTLLKISAIALVNGKRQKEQVRLLSIAGMGPTEIADLLGTTTNTVNVALSALRREKRMNLKSEGDDNG